MKCPVCKQSENSEIDLRTAGFSEDIIECTACGATWSLNHGHLDLVKDSQEKSFLQAQTEFVEADDYNQID